jgi:hypothetical protein
MNTRSLVLIGVAAATLSIGASNAVSASTDSTEPADPVSPHIEAAHAMDTTAATVTVDGSAEPTSPEAEAFCVAELAAERAAAAGGDEEADEALIAAAPDDTIRASVETVLANLEAGGPEFDEAYTAVIDYMKANCGYAQVSVAASEYAFDGLPAELAPGPTIISFANVGTEVHELAVMRVNDGVALTLEELLALPEDEAGSMVAPAGFAFAFPGTNGYATIDFTPGRYVALCFLPQNADPEMIAQMEGPGSSEPEGANFGPPHFTLGMVHEFTVR